MFSAIAHWTSLFSLRHDAAIPCPSPDAASPKSSLNGSLPKQFYDSKSTSASTLPSTSDAESVLPCPNVEKEDLVEALPAGFNADGRRQLSTTRILFAHIGAALTLFLATTDSTIVSTSLPTIAARFNASQTEYTWVGVSYMLTQTVCQPFYGRLSDLVGRKNLLFSSILVFALGSLLCGSAQSITWLIAARGLAGIGGGGIVSSVWVITAEIVEVRKRATWSQALSITWSCSAIAGPLLGGAFSSGSNSTVDWRWAFYLNLPICFIASITLGVALNGAGPERPKDASWRIFLQRFDFIGLLAFMCASCCIIVGFSFASSNGWGSPLTLTLIVVGLVLLVCAGYYETRTTRDALFPPAVFNDLTTTIVLIINFLHNSAFTAGTYYLALYYQTVNDSSPLQAGVLLLPYSLGSSLASMPVAWYLGYRQKRNNDTKGQRYVISVGLVLCTIGFGVLQLLDDNSSLIMESLLPLIAGVGVGMLFHAPYQLFTASLQPHELSTATSAFFLVRFTGATVGLAIAGAIFQSTLDNTLSASSYSQGFQSSGFSVEELSDIQSPDEMNEVIHAAALSIKRIWTFYTPALGLALLLSLVLVVRHSRVPQASPEDSEKVASTSTPQSGIEAAG
ncbi:MFS general substrate transporter [Stereum hirsutum FP-91666 SS1]|uniref:MFS general substrate transporter n=1 Tax=Stereum hirsutum (strain FP-91666) TaxID=721885 RepID=UPI0004449A47|nr:MFS general substrate transporter [Stereum hirsutum FP-91666 SS1]EIM83471.1 MFS general substrate transporter [Stereum hirsutum FP-91666 SS1]